MNILAFKPGHDGQISYLSDGKLIYSIESEKDSWPRHAEPSPSLFLRSLALTPSKPDVVALSGWLKGYDAASPSLGAGYWGETAEAISQHRQTIFGQDVAVFSSSHERSHLMCAYGMSPFPQGDPCYALVWEGNLGSFYRIDENVSVTKIGDVMSEPGIKYAFLFGLADPSFPSRRGYFRFGDAGKLMALASYGKPGRPDAEEAALINSILPQHKFLSSTKKEMFSSSKFHNIGVEASAFKSLARKWSDAIFRRFYRFAEDNLRERLPLLIAGGCGLNCHWNTAWMESNLFADVFVPPCANDSGSAIGTAVDAMFAHTGGAKIDWDVYAGDHFVYDDADLDGLQVRPLHFGEVAAFLRDGNIIAWVQDRYEMGPRALGNRSLLASPLLADNLTKLNRIKRRESFRPIAPICMEEDIDRLFEHQGPSPYMLYFQTVKTDALPAITHVDRSTRIQSVTPRQNRTIHALLDAFREQTGYGVLCNTSLNFEGRGFINRMSDLVRYARSRHLDGFVAGDNFFAFEEKDVAIFQ